MSFATRRRHLKTRLVASAVILSNVAGNFFLSRGLRGNPLTSTGSIFGCLFAFLNPWVLTGVSLLVFWMLARMALLSWADLSYVLPITALGYVLTVLAGRVLLFEQVSWTRWAGTLLIVAGVSLAGRTPVSTTLRRRARR